VFTKLNIKNSRRKDACKMLYDNALDGIVVTFVAFVGLQLWFNNYSNGLETERIIFIVAISIVSVYRTLDTLHWRRNDTEKNADPRVGFIRFFVGNTVSCLLWTAYVFVFLPSMSRDEITASIIIISALTGGATTVLSSHLSICASYIFLMLFPYSSLLVFSSAKEFTYLLGTLGYFFFIVMISMAVKSHRFTKNSIKLKYENKQLAHETEESKREIEKVNSELEIKVTERTKELVDLTNKDPLTQLFNRAGFLSKLKTKIQRASRFNQELAILFIDIDGFKAINDGHGHEYGDFVLVEVANRIGKFAEVRENACRWGGDEFVMVLDGCNAIEAKALGASLISIISEPIKLTKFDARVSATIGISMFPEHSVCSDLLINMADTAMFCQKQNARSKAAVFTQSMRELKLREYYLKTALNSAIANNELSLVYQPVVNQISQEVEFCEVLLRWKHQGEVISPDEFIPIAENYGLIHSVGEWVLTTAFRETTHWVFDKEVAISVNVSVLQLEATGFVQKIRALLEQEDFPGEKLHIELTESVFTKNVEYLANQIRQLQAMDISVSLDDFGTGFSSLAQLQFLAADTVKIDKSFIDNIGSGGHSIIKATQDIAKALNYRVVAEGVETTEQADLLSQIGVSSIQGYLYAKPMSQELLKEWYVAHKSSHKKNV
jgi:diguanylate cyclase (GGDEF)-like protein